MDISPPEILFEDNHIIAVNKKASDIVQKDKSGDISLDEKVKEYIRDKYDKPGEAFLGVVHRLDRPVTGVVLFARTSKALSRLNELFRNKEIKKIYWAVVKDVPVTGQGTLRHYLVRNQEQNKSYCHNYPVSDSKEAVLHYRYLAGSDSYHLLEVHLESGRHHQIRAQLAEIGCPVKGDLKYGFPRSNKDAGIHLHARSIEFIHPVSKEDIRITAPVPDDPLWQVFEQSVASIM